MTRKLFMTGSSGYLGHAVCKELQKRGLDYTELRRADGFDLSRPFDFEAGWRKHAQEAAEDALLFHLGAVSRQSQCEADHERAWRTNSEATGCLAAALGSFGGRLVYVSTDLVFAGTNAPYGPDDEARPKSVYGKSKLGGEWYTMAFPQNLVVRAPLLYGPSFDGKRGATDMVTNAIAAGEDLSLFIDEWRTPLHVDEAARQIVDLGLDEDAVLVRHLRCEERQNRHQLGLRIAEELGLGTEHLVPCKRADRGLEARPEDVSLIEGQAAAVPRSSPGTQA